MYPMTPEQRADMKRRVDQHVRDAIEKYGVPPECYGLNPDDMSSDDDLIISTPSSGGEGVDIPPKSPVYYAQRMGRLRRPIDETSSIDISKLRPWGEQLFTSGRTLGDVMAAMHAAASFARAVPTAAGDGTVSEIGRDVTVPPQDPDCLPWHKPSVRLQYTRDRIQEMLKQKMYAIPVFSSMDYDRALQEPGYYHEGADKRFLYNPMRYQIVRIEHKLVIETMWIVPDKTIYRYLYVTSKPKMLTYDKA